MKKFLITFLAIFIGLSNSPIVYGQTNTQSIQPLTVIKTDEQSVFDLNKNTQSIIERKEYSQKYLEEMSFWTGTLLLRTQLASNRLSQNKINVTDASAYIQEARIQITKAQENLNLFKNTKADIEFEKVLSTSALDTEKALKNAQKQITEGVNVLKSKLSN